MIGIKNYRMIKLYYNFKSSENTSNVFELNFINKNDFTAALYYIFDDINIIYELCDYNMSVMYKFIYTVPISKMAETTEATIIKIYHNIYVIDMITTYLNNKWKNQIILPVVRNKFIDRDYLKMFYNNNDITSLKYGMYEPHNFEAKSTATFESAAYMYITNIDNLICGKFYFLATHYRTRMIKYLGYFKSNTGHLYVTYEIVELLMLSNQIYRANFGNILTNTSSFIDNKILIINTDHDLFCNTIYNNSMQILS